LDFKIAGFKIVIGFRIAVGFSQRKESLKDRGFSPDKGIATK
jgi:hypothetical protein